MKKWENFNRNQLEELLKKYLYKRQHLCHELFHMEYWCVYGARKEFYETMDTFFPDVSTEEIKSFLAKYYGKRNLIK